MLPHNLFYSKYYIYISIFSEDSYYKKRTIITSKRTSIIFNGRVVNYTTSLAPIIFNAACCCVN